MALRSTALLILFSFATVPAFAADVMIVSPYSHRHIRAPYREAPDDPVTAQRMEKEAQLKRYQDVEEELTNPPLTRQEVKEMIDDKLAKKPASPPPAPPAAPAQNNTFGGVGGLGSVGGIGKVGQGQ